MQNFPIVISFYTKNTFYQFEVQNLIESCQRFGLEHSIEGIDSFGSWELNCCYKPFFILQKIKQLQKPVLWVDADGMFLRQPSCIPAFSSDFATRINENCDDTDPSKVISSTVFANYSQGGITVLEKWAEGCRNGVVCETRKEEFWDQIALRDVIELKKNSIVIKALPLSYARIFDHPHDMEDPPVIEHYQAARRFKKFINNPELL